MNSSEATTENVGMGGNKDERQTTSKDETDESSSENQRNEQRQRQMDSEKEDSRFECNICLDMAKDAVVSMCGHLFCWPCLFQWMDTRPYRQLCPVCKSAISKDKGFPGMFHWGGDNGGHGGGGVQFSTPISLWPTNFVRHGSAMSILCLGKVADVYLIDEPSAYLDFEQRLHAAKGIKRKKSGFIVEHDFIMSTYLADRVIVFDGPQPLVNGMNRFLSQQNITFRRDNASHRPRMNKLNSQLDVDQKTSQNYFYLDN